jgi:hypothetical protein
VNFIVRQQLSLRQIFLLFTGGRTCDVEMNLTRVILNPVFYDKSIRPARDHRDVTNVSFDLSLAQLIDVDEKNQIITTNQWITMVSDVFS